jgi:hypothetical protein
MNGGIESSEILANRARRALASSCLHQP